MIRKITILLIVVMSFVGCSDYLDLVPEEDIETIESIFQKRYTALEFFNGAYRFYNDIGTLRNDPGLVATDEITTGEYLRTQSFSNAFYREGFKISQGLQNTSKPILSIWDDTKNYYIGIRHANIFIENVDDVYNMSPQEKNKYKASAKAIKALYYFDLLKRYGPIPLVPDNISVEAEIEEMLTVRAPVDTVVKTIVRLFDEAIPYLEPASIQINPEKGFFTKEAAYTYKAKVLSYAASPLFNGNIWYGSFKNMDGEQLFNTTYDVNKWKKAAKAAKEAINYCESQGHILENVYNESTPMINYITNIQNAAIPRSWDSKELIHGVVVDVSAYYKVLLPRYNMDDENFNNEILGCVNPSLRMVELFYTANGVPIDKDNTWNYSGRYKNGIEQDKKYENVVAINKEVLNLHLRREPRFYANIACDRCFWKRGTKQVEMNPYMEGQHGVEGVMLTPSSKVNITGYWVKKRVAPEQTGGKNSNTRSVAPIARLRLADLYLLRAEAYNEAYGPADSVYNPLNKIRNRAGIPTVQESWNSYSVSPEQITTKEGMREIIQQERMIEFAFEGERFWDLRRWKLAHIYMNQPIKGWNIFGKDNDSFYNQYDGPLVVSKKNKFTTPRDYFWPIRDAEVLKANIKQNLGW